MMRKPSAHAKTQINELMYGLMGTVEKIFHGLLTCPVPLTKHRSLTKLCSLARTQVSHSMCCAASHKPLD